MKDIQQRLRLAMGTAQMAIFDSSIVDGKVIDGTVSWSAESATLLGLKPRPKRHSFRAFLEFVHPDDRALLVETLQQRADACSSYEIEYRLLRADGVERWVTAKAQVICDEQGHPVRTLGIIWDITRRKAQELSITRQKELAELTLSSIGDGVVTTDAQGRTQYLNRVAEQLTGWTTKLAHGVDVGAVLRLIDEDTGTVLENVAVKTLRLRQAIGISPHTQLVTREGRRIAIEDSAAPIWSREGEVLGAVAVFRDVSHERKLSHQLSWNATHDTLTGLINRREFEAQIAAALHSAKEEGHIHALLYMDLDQFKVINDTSGHIAGDVLLQLLSKMLQTQMRDSDILARLGGDELGVLLPHCPLARAAAIADQIRQSIKDFRFVWENRTFELGVSIGLVEIDENSKSMTELLIAADRACYLAKEQGRNRVHLYKESDVMLAQRHGEMLWVTRLNEAFEQNRFRLFAQPIVGLRGGTEAHDEVLIRIASGKGALVLPGAFIPAAERYDLMTSIDRWVIRNVCLHLKNERDARADSGAVVALAQERVVTYSINLSGVSLNDDSMLDYITEQFKQFNIPPGQICFEITETAIISNLPKAQVFMARLQRLGCRFSLDDFGSGLSSFAYLKALPVNYLKIDGIFIRGIATNPINRAMVKAINEVGHVMGIQTVAEYVEDSSTLDVVRSIGIDYAQGYAVGQLRPLSLAAASA